MRTPTGALVALALVPLSTVDVKPRQFTVAIVRTDGRLVPFAAYDGGRWEKAWPEPDEAIAGKPTIDEVPSVWHRRGERVPKIWHVWRTRRAAPIETRVTGAEVVEAHCQGQIALKTTLPEAKRKRSVDAPAVEGRAGLAVHPSNVPVGAIERLPRSHVLWRKAEEVVRAGFDSREKAQALADQRQLPRYEPTPRVRLSELYRQARSPGSLLYFVAERAYPTGPFFAETTCPSHSIMSGWLVPTNAGVLTLLDPRMFVTDCDGKETRTAFPLGALRVGKRSFWVIQEHGWEDETYNIVEVGPSELRLALKVDGGGC